MLAGLTFLNLSAVSMSLSAFAVFAVEMLEDIVFSRGDGGQTSAQNALRGFPWQIWGYCRRVVK
jgi:hypothetical protein